MRRIFVTGANKGVGLAIVEAILAEHADSFVYLGSRDLERGNVAAAELARQRTDVKNRLEVVPIDVADAGSVEEAGRRVSQSLRGEKLYGLVNNAGIGPRTSELSAAFETNTVGVYRVCEAFLPLLDPQAGRVVNVTSAAGPSYVATCSPERQRFFLEAQLTWQRLRGFMDECLALAGDSAGAGTSPAYKAAFARQGLGDGSPYGLSKACANTYTLILAREHPGLQINACTPGFIATDMTRYYAESAGKSPAELGMKTPAEGARAPLHLLFGTLQGTGHYYGSDAQRSPLDRYRAPGSPAYGSPEYSEPETTR
jgi:NAD(P)-dependent dehydrogenase (short-subunit alcohol dehydrogenase family)